MSAPVLWILFPGLLAAGLYILGRWERFMAVIGILAAAGLAWLAWRLPIGETISLGPLPFLSSIELGDTFTVLGRRFVVANSMRPLLSLIYLGVSFWFGGAVVARTHRLFIPLGLAIAALLVAALAVEPFLYAALLIEIAALVSVPILSSPGRPVGRGVLRFLTFQTLGMPFILFTGWMLTGVEANPANSELVLRATLVIALGFAFTMAIFPFHTWIPMLTEEAHPYAAAFVFFMLPGVISLFGLGFLSRYPWMGSEPLVYLGLRFIGTLMVVTGGIWAAFQRHLGRMLGYAVIVEIGLSLLALSLGSGAPGGLGRLHLGIFFTLFLPRGLGLGLWALALAVIQARSGEVSFRSVQGTARQLPLAAACLVLAHLSLAGLPLLAGFPVHIALWGALAQQSLPAALLTLLGNAGLLAGAVRTLVVLVMGSSEENWCSAESWSQRLLLSLAGLLLFLVGIFPQWFLPALASMAGVFGS